MTITPEVADALANGLPVVALESTIITHGMPYPDNRDTAQLVQQDVRDCGAVPATIAVIDGVIRIGLDDTALDALARRPDARKLSRADLAICIAQKATGATTVAATMILAHQAGIGVFATGGIGGVHRGAEKSFDISADLRELSETPVTVVAAGVKAILDIPKTLEVLETLGVPVITVGQDEFPAFWARKSGIAAPLRMDWAKEIADAQKIRTSLGLPGGQLVAHPIPAEAEIELAEMAQHIDQAITEANQQGISQKQVTPFLLNRIFELTNGRSLSANIALVRANARFAAEIAGYLCK